MLNQIATLQDLDSCQTSGRSAVLYFWAAWCDPCRHMDAVMLELCKQHPDIAFCRIEAEVVDEVTMKYNVASVPTFVFTKGSSVVDTLEGADSAALTQKVVQLAAGGGAGAAAAAAAPAPAAAVPDINGRIKYLLATSPVVLFMKGTAEEPRCGFSRTVVGELQKLHAPLHCVDILQDEELRAGVKEFGQWPTYPQLYVQGELVGGCDIIKEMAASGELQQLLVDKLGADYATAGARPAAAAAAAAPQAAPAAAAVSPAAAAAGAQPWAASTIARIDTVLASHDVMLFMKGNPAEPRCGFSRKVVEALTTAGVAFGTFDILGDEEVRQTLKEYKEWPTYPQVYAKGELLGGCDIILEMAASGELKGAVQDALQAKA